MCNSNPNYSNNSICQIRANKSNKITVSIFCQKIKIIKSNIIKQFVSLEQCKAKIEKFIKRNRYKIKINNNLIYFNFIYPIKIKLLLQDALNNIELSSFSDKIKNLLDNNELNLSIDLINEKLFITLMNLVYYQLEKILIKK